MALPTKFFVFDVESIGLHGEGFAVGFVVVDREGNELERGLFAASPHCASGLFEGHKWVKENIPDIDATHSTPWMVRAAFWRRWMYWKEQEAVLAADCSWPVEARFLIACVEDNLLEREWRGPYPLIDISSVLFAQGTDPLKEFDRLSEELPRHNPLKDAIQSARIFLNALAIIDALRA